MITDFLGFLKEVDGKMNLPWLLLRLEQLPPLHQLHTHRPIRDLVIELEERIDPFDVVWLVQNRSKVRQLVEQVLKLWIEDLSHVDFQVWSVGYVEEVGEGFLEGVYDVEQEFQHYFALWYILRLHHLHLLLRPLTLLLQRRTVLLIILLPQRFFTIQKLLRLCLLELLAVLFCQELIDFVLKVDEAL